MKSKKDTSKAKSAKIATVPGPLTLAAPPLNTGIDPSARVNSAPPAPPPVSTVPFTPLPSLPAVPFAPFVPSYPPPAPKPYDPSDELIYSESLVDGLPPAPEPPAYPPANLSYGSLQTMLSQALSGGGLGGLFSNLNGFNPAQAPTVPFTSLPNSIPNTVPNVTPPFPAWGAGLAQPQPPLSTYPLPATDSGYQTHPTTFASPLTTPYPSLPGSVYPPLPATSLPQPTTSFGYQPSISTYPPMPAGMPYDQPPLTTASTPPPGSSSLSATVQQPRAPLP
jgi:hypothetical protein